jgi:glycine/D-amino acid oxidase-like deaminating enzyme
MLGMSMATGTGQMIAQMIDEQVPSVDPSAYRLQS